MRLEKSACQVLRLCRPSFNVDDEKDFRTQHSRRPSEKYKLSQSSATTRCSPGDCKTAKRSRRPREKERRKEELRDSRVPNHSRIRAISVDEESREPRLRTVVLNNGENDADCGTPSSAARGKRRSEASRMETSQSKSIGNHPGTTCANYFAKQFLAIVTTVAAAAAASRSTVTILVRSGRYSVAGQCLSIQTSVSDVATRWADVRVP